MDPSRLDGIKSKIPVRIPTKRTILLDDPKTVKASTEQANGLPFSNIGNLECKAVPGGRQALKKTTQKQPVLQNTKSSIVPQATKKKIDVSERNTLNTKTKPVSVSSRKENIQSEIVSSKSKNTLRPTNSNQNGQSNKNYAFGATVLKKECNIQQSLATNKARTNKQGRNQECFNTEDKNFQNASEEISTDGTFDSFQDERHPSQQNIEFVADERYRHLILTEKELTPTRFRNSSMFRNDRPSLYKKIEYSTEAVFKALAKLKKENNDNPRASYISSSTVNRGYSMHERPSLYNKSIQVVKQDIEEKKDNKDNKDKVDFIQKTPSFPPRERVSIYKKFVIPSGDPVENARKQLAALRRLKEEEPKRSARKVTFKMSPEVMKFKEMVEAKKNNCGALKSCLTDSCATVEKRAANQFKEPIRFLLDPPSPTTVQSHQSFESKEINTVSQNSNPTNSDCVNYINTTSDEQIARRTSIMKESSALLNNSPNLFHRTSENRHKKEIETLSITKNASFKNSHQNATVAYNSTMCTPIQNHYLLLYKFPTYTQTTESKPKFIHSALCCRTSASCAKYCQMHTFSISKTNAEKNILNLNKSNNVGENWGSANICIPTPVSLYSKGKFQESVSPEFFERRSSAIFYKAPINTPLALRSLAKSSEDDLDTDCLDNPQDEELFKEDPKSVCQRLIFDDVEKEKDNSAEIAIHEILTNKKRLDQLADEECHEILENAYVNPSLCRQLINPIARILNEGDDMHFVPIQL